MAIQFYRQCTLTRGSTNDIAWIPESMAVSGKFLEISGDNGWMVSTVGKNRVDGAYLKEHERNYLTQRQASDI